MRDKPYLKKNNKKNHFKHMYDIYAACSPYQLAIFKSYPGGVAICNNDF